MMREEDHLGLLRQFGQHLEPRRSTYVIEIIEQVIGDKRQRHALVDEILHRGDAQRQIELVGRARAHSADANRGLVGTHARVIDTTMECLPGFENRCLSLPFILQALGIMVWI